VTEALPPEDPDDALIREHAGQIEALTALVSRWASFCSDHLPR
jgi:hypothetical protein